MESPSVRLQERDIKITQFLRQQGYATFYQLKDQFFPSIDACSKRLRALESSDYIQSIRVNDFFKGQRNFTPILLGLNLHPLEKIYSLSRTFRKQVPETNRLLKYHMCLHQLLLNDSLNKLKNASLDQYLILNDPQLKMWSLIDAGRRKEFTPDLSFEMKDQTLAVELERTLKSHSRYAERFGFYQNSNYTHVLYLYYNDGHLPTLLKYAGSMRKIAFAHYLDPLEVFSNAWGYMPLSSWVKKLTEISKL